MAGRNYTQNEDLEFGARGEAECIDRISRFLGRAITLQGGYSVLDIDGEVCGDIKSRRVAYDAYPSFMVGLNKILRFQNSAKDCYVFFNLLDDLYYVKYDSNLFSEFAPTIFQRVRANQTDDPSEVIYIPKNHNGQTIIHRVPN